MCGLTYDFAWDDDAQVYGEAGEEQAKARTVKDYLEAVESDQGHTSWRYTTTKRCRRRSLTRPALVWKRLAGKSRRDRAAAERTRKKS